MNFYYANNDYFSFLHLVENKVALIEGEKESRPFLGLLICVGGKNYFAPLTSPKPKHKRMKDSEDFIRIDNGVLGAINLNNMLPIPKSCYYKIEINNIQNEKYARLLKLQKQWCDFNKYKINSTAQKLYDDVKNGTINNEILQRCCNYKLLEKKCFEYMKVMSINEEEVEYIIK